MMLSHDKLKVGGDLFREIIHEVRRAYRSKKSLFLLAPLLLELVIPFRVLAALYGLWFLAVLGCFRFKQKNDDI